MGQKAVDEQRGGALDMGRIPGRRPIRCARSVRVLPVDLALKPDQEDDENDGSDEDGVAVHLEACLGDGDSESAEDIHGPMPFWV